MDNQVCLHKTYHFAPRFWLSGIFHVVAVYFLVSINVPHSRYLFWCHPLRPDWSDVGMNPLVHYCVLVLCRGSGHLFILGRIGRWGSVNIGCSAWASSSSKTRSSSVIIFRAGKLGVSPWLPPWILGVPEVHSQCFGRSYVLYLCKGTLSDASCVAFSSVHGIIPSFFVLVQV